MTIITYGTAEVRRVHTPAGPCAVVMSAPRHIAITDELYWEITEGRGEQITGAMTIDGTLLSFGTPGRHLGRVVYRITGRDERTGHHLADRIRVGLYDGEDADA